MSLPPYRLITKGLGGPACQGLITGYFYLGIFKAQVIITPPTSGGGGGSIPLRPGEIKDFYKPVQPNKTYFPKKDLTDVTVKITFRNETFITTYKVRPTFATVIAKIININNITVDRIRVTAQNLEVTAKRLVATVKNLGSKKDRLKISAKNINNDNSDND